LDGLESRVTVTVYCPKKSLSALYYYLVEVAESLKLRELEGQCTPHYLSVVFQIPRRIFNTEVVVVVSFPLTIK
jgi:hypothetical protein